MIDRSEDVRWRQRLANFRRAFSRLADAVALARQRPLSDLERQGLIQAFEFTHELAWNLIRDYFRYQGNTGIMGSRDAVREAFAAGLVSDGEGWMDMIASRNRTSHTYNEAVAADIATRIIGKYTPLFELLLTRMNEIELTQGEG